MTQAHLIERLSAQDLAALWWDSYGWPGDIGALIIVEGAGLVGRDGRFRIEAVREAIGPRLHLLPRFRQLLYRPRRGLGWPLWVDAPSLSSLTMCGFPRCPRQGSTRSSCWHVSSCGGSGWIPHARCGRRGSCLACRWGRSACSCGCTTPWPTGSQA